MKQLLIKDGGVVVAEVSAPVVARAGILVRVTNSCVSVGTEMASVRNSGMPLYRRALQQPDNVKKVLQMVRDQGVRRTLARVSGKLASGTPTGYSVAGVVVEVGADSRGFRVGDQVACAGAGVANHAEVVAVPVNLAVKVPEGLDLGQASTVTLGAIALQGVRRVEPTLGETVAVIGLGILGQLAMQMLRANGCRVIGVDPDARRLEVGKRTGMNWAVNPAQGDPVERIHKLTEGRGADAVLIAAATASHEVLHQAMRACRRKGRVVLLGDVGCNVRREDWYRKELDFRISCSYGPGRYDPNYEEQGQDYPFAYVRWTENRNMEEYLRLVAEGRIDLAPLASESFTIDRAAEAYAALKSEGEKPLLVVLEYPERPGYLKRKVELRSAATRTDRVRVALAGAGGFAQGVHLPNLVKQRADFELLAVMNRTGSTAHAVATQYQALYETTDYGALLADERVDLVMIATRHDLHGAMVLQALSAGKHVFVEKPLTLDRLDLAAIRSFYAANPTGPVLMTGYNRRFAPAIAHIQGVLNGRTTPLIVNYRMNAGFIPLDSWVQGPEGGGRNLGEACHIYDLFDALTGATVEHVQATAIEPSSTQWAKNDNFVATLKYQDGSVCTLTYTALGNKAHPKETMEIFVDGLVITMVDFQAVQVLGGRHRGWNAKAIDKGHGQELAALAACLRRGSPWPIALESQLQSAAVALDVEDRIYGRITLGKGD